MSKRKYKSSRDIPLAARELQTLSASKIAKWVKENRTEKDKKTGKRKQKVIDPSGITHWLNRHPEIKQQLASEIVEEELPKDAISETLFQNGVFEEIESIKKWKIHLRASKNAKPDTIRGFMGYIKRACQGIVAGRGKKLDILEDWGLKHPDELTVDDALQYIYEMKNRDMHTRNARLAFRNYFTSRGMKQTEVNRISGKLEGAGKYAHLYTPKAKIYAIFDYLVYRNAIIARASKFAYKTACRSGATFNAEYKYINYEEHTIVVFEKASRGQEKRRMVKLIPPDLWEELGLNGNIRKKGKLFNINKKEVNALLREAYQHIIPELADEIPMPFHFWRHQFAQHMLRALKWNYTFVAELGGWTEETLKRYYGKPPQEVIRQAGLKALPNI